MQSSSKLEHSTQPQNSRAPRLMYEEFLHLQQQRLQVCENNYVRKNSKSKEGRQEKNDGVKGRDGSAEVLDNETVEEQTTVGRTHRKDSG